MAIAIDTMVLVNAFNKGSKYHKEAIEILEREEVILCFPQNFVELYNVLSKFLDRKKLIISISYLFAKFRFDNISIRDFLTAVEISQKFSIRIFDSLIISFALNRKLRLMTFDKKLKKIYDKVKETFQ